MPGLNLDMGMGAGASYAGPVYSASASEVPTSGGYPDAGYGQMAFGPDGVAGEGSRHANHALTFGGLCFILLLVYWWTLPK